MKKIKWRTIIVPLGISTIYCILSSLYVAHIVSNILKQHRVDGHAWIPKWLARVLMPGWFLGFLVWFGEGGIIGLIIGQIIGYIIISFVCVFSYKAGKRLVENAGF